MNRVSVREAGEESDHVSGVFSESLRCSEQEPVLMRLMQRGVWGHEPDRILAAPVGVFLLTAAGEFLCRAGIQEGGCGS